MADNSLYQALGPQSPVAAPQAPGSPGLAAGINPQLLQFMQANNIKDPVIAKQAMEYRQGGIPHYTSGQLPSSPSAGEGPVNPEVIKSLHDALTKKP